MKGQKSSSFPSQVPRCFSDASETDPLLKKDDSLVSLSMSQITDVIQLHEEAQSQPKELNQFFATAICGCNITSSCLYVISLSAVSAGAFTPFIMILISFLLYLFRSIYNEVVTALPVNGGTYNLLKTTMGQKSGALVGCLTMLSYVTTAVISSSSGTLYFKRTMDVILEEPISEFTVRLLPFCILTFAAGLNIIGISQSASVALMIFVMHLLTMFALIICCMITALGLFGMETPMSPFADESNPQTMLGYNWYGTVLPDGLFLGLFFGFSSGLLGVSGFESSANFVESQKPGVFPKTLRNMWIIVSILNISLSYFALCHLEIGTIAGEAQKGALLSLLAHQSAGGMNLRILVGLDAGIILVGAVLSAFVGFTGLCHRMAVDGCLPPFFTSRNHFRGTLHWIIIFYWALTCAMTWFCEGDLGVMGGIYTVAFLSVMGAFAIGNMQLKTLELRFSLPQCENPASWITVTVGFIGVTLGLIGNLISRGLTTLIGCFMFTSLFLAMTAISLHCSKKQNTTLQLRQELHRE